MKFIRNKLEDNEESNLFKKLQLYFAMSCNISFLLKINFEANFVEIGIFVLEPKVEKWKRKSETMRGESFHHTFHISLIYPFIESEQLEIGRWCKWC